MEFLTGVRKKEALTMAELLNDEKLGHEVKVNGVIHNIREMGDMAFISSCQ